ncbi:hypothetical protein DL771_009428 [Monosporascus sp. 5C6A]|nr:hypothetical protein DL771_009428 [Monosporascus sp. 5C6A]
MAAIRPQSTASQEAARIGQAESRTKTPVAAGRTRTEGIRMRFPEPVPQPNYAKKALGEHGGLLEKSQAARRGDDEELQEAFPSLICAIDDKIDGPSANANSFPLPGALARAVSSAMGLDYASNTAKTPSRVLVIPFLWPQVHGCFTDSSAALHEGHREHQMLQAEPHTTSCAPDGGSRRFVAQQDARLRGGVGPMSHPEALSRLPCQDARATSVENDAPAKLEDFSKSPVLTCRDFLFISTASLSPSMSMTSPELIWAQVQEKKQRESVKRARMNRQVKSSAASTYSECTTRSFDKDQIRNTPKPRRSLRDRVKDAFRGGAGRPSTTT